MLSHIFYSLKIFCTGLYFLCESDVTTKYSEAKYSMWSWSKYRALLSTFYFVNNNPSTSELLVMGLKVDYPPVYCLPLMTIISVS